MNGEESQEVETEVEPEVENPPEVPDKVEVPDKTDVAPEGHLKKREIEMAQDGNPVFKVDDKDYRGLINRRAGSHWRTSNSQLKDWVKGNKNKQFWVVNKEDETRKYLYVAPRRAKKE